MSTETVRTVENALDESEALLKAIAKQAIDSDDPDVAEHATSLLRRWYALKNRCESIGMCDRAYPSVGVIGEHT